ALALAACAAALLWIGGPHPDSAPRGPLVKAPAPRQIDPGPPLVPPGNTRAAPSPIPEANLGREKLPSPSGGYPRGTQDSGWGWRLGEGFPKAPAPLIADQKFLNDSDLSLLVRFMTGNPQDEQVRAWFLQRLPKVRDDFVEVPLPRLASADL